MSATTNHFAKKIIDIDVEDEVADSFLAYSLSVITSRAIPDVRDGLKPVQRRILYGMHTLGVRPSASYMKCARVVGEVIGKYHPHGDSACYEALVRLAQDFSMQTPLVDGQGNFGNLDDGPAAMRYCITGDTRVALADGTTAPIAELVPDVSSDSETDIDVKVLDWRGNPAQASKFFHSGEHDTRRITVRGGLELRGTDNHPVLTLAAIAGVPVFQWRLLSELIPGEFVALERSTTTGRACTSTEKSLALLAGMLASKGWGDERRCGFSTCDKAYFDAAVAGWDAVIGKPREVSWCTLGSGQVVWEFDCLDGLALSDTQLSELAGLSSGERYVPEVVRRMPGTGKSAFLAALFEGDGGFRQSLKGSLMVYYSTRSARLASEVVEMLLELGIVSSRYVNLLTGEHVVRITSTEEIAHFADKVGFHFAKAKGLQVALGHIAVTGQDPSDDIIPYVSDYLWAEADQPGRRRLAKHDLSSSYIWRTKPDELLAWVGNPETVAVVKPVVTSGFLFREVVSNDAGGREAVYSLRVDSTDHSFIAGRFVNHNTECRMAPAAIDMLSDVDEGTVDWSANYDNKDVEPDVLPARLPNLLINGTTGIAVGMATNLAPHNPAEVLAAMRLLLGNPDATLNEVMQVLPGPDFPTGGRIVDDGGIREAYLTGRGGFRVRGAAEIAPVSARKRGIIVTALPYTVGPERFIARVKALVSSGSLVGVSNVVDLSDRHHGLKVVVECKAGASAEVLLGELYRKTPLEEGFAINAVVLVGGQPQTLGLVELCKHWLEHRLEVLRRRSQFRIDRAEARAHILEGLLCALASIDEVVAIIKGSKDTATARTTLIGTFELSEIQAEHILDMALRRLVALEVAKLTGELTELKEQISSLRALLDDQVLQREAIDAEIELLLGSLNATRRTPILSADTVQASQMAVVEAEKATPACHVVLGPGGNLARVSLQETASKRTRFAELCLSVGTGSQMHCVGADGTLDAVAVGGLGAVGDGAVAWGHATSIEPKALFGDSDAKLGPLVIVTANGVIKRVAHDQLPTRLPGSVIKLAKGDAVVAAFCCGEDTDVVMVTQSGQVLRTAVAKVRPQGRTAGGVAGIKLGEGDRVLAAGVAGVHTQVGVLTDSGRVKVTAVSEFPSKGRGTRGVRGVRLRADESHLTDAVVGPGLYGVRNKHVVKLSSCEGRRDATANEPPSRVTSLAVARGALW